MSAVLSVLTDSGLELDIPVRYAGDAATGYNSASISLDTPSETLELSVIAIQNMSALLGETLEMSYIFDTQKRSWTETEELLALSASTDARSLLGADSNETRDIVSNGQIKLTGQESLDGVETHVLSGNLPAIRIAGTEADLGVTYHIGIEDNLLRQVEITDALDPRIIAPLTNDSYEGADHANLTVKFSDYGKKIDYSAPHLIFPRFSHNATLLDDGRVLVSGGWTGIANNNVIAPSPILFSQAYDPSTGAWTFMNRIDPFDPEELPKIFVYGSLNKLPDGKIVSVAIALNDENPNENNPVVAVLAVFDPQTNAWGRLSEIPSNRAFSDVIVLDDERILVIGGFLMGGLASVPAPLSLVEAYDPDSGDWQTLEPMNSAVAEQTLVTLSDGRILVAGGFDEPNSLAQITRAEIYDPATGAWTLTGSLNSPLTLPVAVSLPDGRALITGNNIPPTATASDSSNSEIYDPDTGEWTSVAPMSQNRTFHTLTLMPDGRVLAVGGEDPNGADHVLLSTTEIFDPETHTWSPGPDLSQPRSNHSATLMPDGGILLAGGIVTTQSGEIRPVTSIELITP